jgi:hypothetical protein
MNWKIIADLVRRWPEIYDAAVERLLNSPDPAVRNHFFIGLSLYDLHPVLYPRELQNLGALFLGDPGSNKTSICFSSLITQMIAARDMAVTILDQKGDPALFERARVEADQAGLPFFLVHVYPSAKLVHL